MTAVSAQTMPPIIELDSPQATDPARVGQKAARLAELLAAGFDVPTGTIMPAELAHAGAESRAAVAAAVTAAHPGPLAVRSSALAEDLAGESFAGMYATVLDVSGAEALDLAISEVVASANGERVRAYHGSGSEMAVLIQRLVPAEQAGVAFTADPITGDRDVVVVHAVRGLGDALVSGEVDPEEWEVRDEPLRRYDGGVLSGEQARAVADLARRVEAHAGEPRDIEWAFAEGKLWLLQARPITALPVKPEMPEPPPGHTWMKDRAHWSEPMTQFGFSTYTPAISHAIEHVFGEFGVMVERLDCYSRGGEVYGHMVPVGSNGTTAPPPPAFLIGLVARIIPVLRRRMRAARDAVRAGKLESIPREWEQTLRGQFESEIEAMLREDVTSLGDPELLDHIERARDLLARGQIAHFRIALPYMVAIGELGMICAELLGWDAGQTMRLLTGLSAASSAPTRALAAMAERVRERPETREALAHMTSVATLATVDPEIADAFRDFELRHGWRAIAYDPGSTTLAERPELIARLILDNLEREVTANETGSRGAAEADARDALAGQPDKLAQFERALDTARRVYPLREENIALTDNFPCGILRRAMLEVGRRLRDRGRLRAREDARFFSLEELAAALAPGATEDLRPVAERRLAEERWVRANPGPDFLGPRPGDPPDTRWLPAEGRRINAAVMWCMDLEMAPAETSTGDELRGRSGSPGRVRGRVRVVRSERDFSKLEPGEVLVCPITSPVWSVLFANASAIVTDGGGAMSHAAIIAREHGIPAVLATGDATSRLGDGEWVVVDGTRGLVSRCARPDGPAQLSMS